MASSPEPVAENIQARSRHSIEVHAVESPGLVPAELASSIDDDGTIRHNVSVAQLLSDEESQSLQEWVARSEGPWREDLARYPGPTLDRSGEGDPEVFDFIHSGFRCELFRNDYLAWCGSVQLTEGHPDYDTKLGTLASSLTVHGGLASRNFDGITRPGCFMFDCCHARLDLVPYSVFVGAKNDRKRVGLLAPAEDKGKGKGKGGGGLLLLPSANCAPPPPLSVTYKDYSYARGEVLKLAEQFRKRASSTDA